MKTKIFVRRVALRTAAAALLAFGHSAMAEEPTKEDDASKKPDAADVGTREELKLPGLTVRAKEGYVDVDATICLTAGFLELIATTKDNKEHESIVAIDAKPSHVHAALLLLGAKPGNPAMAKRLDDGGWLDIAPSGGEIGVFLAYKDAGGKEVERPIGDFIMRGQEEDSYGPDAVEVKPEDRKRFPKSNFLFAGSQLYKDDNGVARYLSDGSGNVISLSTFGDELLCLPGKHSQENIALAWEIDPTHIPPLGTKVALRLRPVRADGKPKP
ncbi:hypothetical protein HZ994_01780 [Akkermansiaceae bacterium]|nr:hypothetical protein HZ994_01780 [Akkermansiaceae bacterium]